MFISCSSPIPQRWHILEYPNLGETDWWPQVDSTMVTFRTKKETTADILEYVLLSFRSDLKLMIYTVHSTKFTLKTRNASVTRQTPPTKSSHQRTSVAGSTRSMHMLPKSKEREARRNARPAKSNGCPDNVYFLCINYSIYTACNAFQTSIYYMFFILPMSWSWTFQ